MTRYFFTSVSRISPLPDLPFTVEPLPREFWATGDYVVGEVNARPDPICATDPYSVVELVAAYGQAPDLVAGVTTNTEAGIELVQNLCGIKALNLLSRESLWELRAMLRKALDLSVD